MVLVSIKETAAVLCVTERTVRDWVAKGRIAYRKIGHLIKIEQETVDAILNANKFEPSPTKNVATASQRGKRVA